MKRNSHLHKEKNTSTFYMQAGVCVGYNVDDFNFQSTRSGEQELQLFQRESRRSLGVRSQGTRLSGGVGAGTGAVTPATRRSGARAAACGGPPPRGAGPARTYTFFFFKKVFWREGRKNFI